MSPVFLFLPYLLLYLLAAALAIPVRTLTSVFEILHILAAISLMVLVWSRRHDLRKVTPQFAFFFCLFVFFILRGAYLEFPSDPWEHVRRIFSWQHYSTLREAPHWSKFSYFWGWTTLHRILPENRRVGLDVFGAGWQVLLALQIYRLSRAFRFSIAASLTQSIGFWFLFGHNVFSFRYYALSSTSLAYAAYLEFLILASNWLNREGKAGSFLPALGATAGLVLLMTFNHLQEVLLFGISVFAFAIIALRKAGRIHPTRQNVFYVLICLLICYLASYLVLGKAEFKNWLFHLSRSWRAYDPFSGYLSRWGAFRLWNLKGHYFETLGIHGVLSIGLAFFSLRRRPELATLTLTPFLLCFFPPFVLFLVAATEVPNTYRVLYAFPTCVILIATAFDFFSRLWSRRPKWYRYSEALAALTTLGILLPVALSPQSPWRGRLWFELHRADPTLELRPLDELAQWTQNNLMPLTGCSLQVDHITGFYLSSQFGIPLSLTRNIPGARWDLAEEVLQHPEKARYCNVLIPVSHELPPVKQSPVALYSGHWDAASQNFALQIAPEIEARAARAFRSGWTEQMVPPFYRLYRKLECNYVCLPSDPLYK